MIVHLPFSTLANQKWPKLKHLIHEDILLVHNLIQLAVLFARRKHNSVETKTISLERSS